MADRERWHGTQWKRACAHITYVGFINEWLFMSTVRKLSFL